MRALYTQSPFSPPVWHPRRPGENSIKLQQAVRRHRKWKVLILVGYTTCCWNTRIKADISRQSLLEHFHSVVPGCSCEKWRRPLPVRNSVSGEDLTSSSTSASHPLHLSWPLKRPYFTSALVLYVSVTYRLQHHSLFSDNKSPVLSRSEAKHTENKLLHERNSKFLSQCFPIHTAILQPHLSSIICPVCIQQCVVWDSATMNSMQGMQTRH